MKVKTKLSDYKTTTVTIEYNGNDFDLEIRSIASREFREATSEYMALMDYAKANDIELKETKEIDSGLGLVHKKEVQTDYAKKAMSILIASLVVDWPFDEDLKAVILKNPELGELIDGEASKLAQEFKLLKKT
ncbi:hypothetical protein NVP1233A_15 [Vibrio phage 1.233.A._10N.261.51.E6]|nr:hypothetical protein NVP1233A_15 [Vibrio phage 1.233.A._10N.261.51.E6]AUR96888.1 hypothetical protein NVP1233B_15 [Vibrio phage 1.233.B._10N.261.51.E6]